MDVEEKNSKQNGANQEPSADFQTQVGTDLSTPGNERNKEAQPGSALDRGTAGGEHPPCNNPPGPSPNTVQWDQPNPTKAADDETFKLADANDSHPTAQRIHRQNPAGIVFIAAKGYPNRNLSDEQLDTIESRILDAILEMDDETEKPGFKSTRRTDGRLMLTCKDDDTKAWLVEFIGKNELCADAPLETFSSSSGRVRATAVLPPCGSDGTTKLLTYLSKQNKGLRVQLWEVLNRVDSEKETRLDLEVDGETAQVLKKCTSVCYKLSSGDIIVSGVGSRSSSVDTGLPLASHVEFKLPGLNPVADLTPLHNFNPSRQQPSPAESGPQQQQPPVNKKRRRHHRSRYRMQQRQRLDSELSGCSHEPHCNEDLDPSLDIFGHPINDQGREGRDHQQPSSAESGPQQQHSSGRRRRAQRIRRHIKNLNSQLPQTGPQGDGVSDPPMDV